MIEVEVKAKTEDLNEIKSKLIEKNAKFLADELQKDSVYGFKNDFPPKDGGIIARIREKNNKFFLELKEIDRDKGGIELKYEVKEPKSAHNFLKKLNFHHFFTMEKKREKYELNGFNICLDKVKELGNFIEVEKIIDLENLKQKTMQECKELLEQIAPNAVIIKEKYGDMMCEKLNIKREE